MTHWNFLDLSMMGSMMLPSSMQAASSASPLLRRRKQPNPILRPSIPLLEYYPDHSLIQLIRERDWYGVRLRLQQKYAANANFCDGVKSRQDVVSCSTKEGPPETTTPLHAACLYRAPPDVILRLIQADPTALTTTDAEGWIPLHVHLLYHNSSPDNTCSTPTLAMIAAGGVTAANRHLRFGGAALHLACRHGAALAVLQALVDLAPQQIATPTPSGSFAAHMLLRSSSATADHGARNKNNSNNNEKECVEKLLVLIRAWVQYKTSNKTQSIRVADVVRFQVACAPGADVVGEFLSSRYYRRERQKQRGSKRNADATALHVAAAAPVTFFDPLLPVLKALPESASIRPYPLHIALRCSHSVLRNCTALLDAFPAALEERDARSRLYPFQLAAAFGEDNLAKTTHCSQLDRIYSLLRQAPHVLSNHN